MKKGKLSLIVFYLLLSQTRILFSQDILDIPNIPDNKKICFALYTVHEKTLKLTAQFFRIRRNVFAR